MKECSNVTISKLNYGDKKETLKLFEITIKSAFAEQGVGHLTEIIAEEVENKMRMMKSFLEGNTEYLFLIAKLEGKVVGAISFGKCGNIIQECCSLEINPAGELGSLYVLPEYQHKGIGSKLINSMMIHLRQSEVENFCLDSGFKKAQAKWTKKFGQPYKVMKDYWGEGTNHYIWYCRVKDL
jgi:GNAT superfamily N-acetyltransferase